MPLAGRCAVAQLYPRVAAAAAAAAAVAAACELLACTKPASGTAHARTLHAVSVMTALVSAVICLLAVLSIAIQYSG
jgi:hypothetical protein